jgi:phosphoribosylpyrophosphate synthetase
VPVECLTAAHVLLNYLRDFGADALVVISPVAGRVKVAEQPRGTKRHDLS